jgi:hypothetical protein
MTVTVMLRTRVLQWQTHDGEIILFMAGALIRKKFQADRMHKQDNI